MQNLIDSSFIQRAITGTIICSSLYHVFFSLPVYYFTSLIFSCSIIAYKEFRFLHLGEELIFSIQNGYNMCILFYIYYTTLFQIQNHPFVLTNIVLFKSVSVVACPIEMYKTISDFYQDLYGVIYTLYLPSYVILSYNRNKLQLWYDILAISGFDVGGYIVGKYIGNTKFNIYSPQKTVEGVLGGAVFCGSFCYFVGGYSLAKVFFLMFFALFGDLFESYIKRSNNKKDSGSIIYGHGGILDRIDSHLFTLCFLHLWF